MDDFVSIGERRVECDRREVRAVGLDEHGADATLGGEAAKPIDQRRCDPLAPVRLVDSQIVEVKLLTFLLELGQNVCGRSTYHLTVCDRCDREK